MTISEASGNVKIVGMKMNSDRRLEAFYWVGAAMIGVVFVFLLLAQPNQIVNAAAKSAAQPPSQSTKASPP